MRARRINIIILREKTSDPVPYLIAPLNLQLTPRLVLSN